MNTLPMLGAVDFASIIWPVVGISLVLIILGAIWAGRYTKVGPNQVLVVSGRSHRYRDPDGTVQARGFRIAVRHQDPFASLLAFGVTLSLVLQGVVNAGVVLGCLPTKGLTLPFLSYGGSAMVAALAQIGVLLALARETG